MRKFPASLMAASALILVAGCGASGGSGGALKAQTTTTAAGSATTVNSDTTTKANETTTTGGTTDTTSDRGSGGGTIPVASWADTFCGNFGSWIDDIKTISNDAGNGITPGDVAGAKQAVINLFGKASDRTQTLIADIDSGGVPDINKGDALIKDLEGKFKDFDDAIQSAKSDAEALDTSNATQFQGDVKGLVDRFQAEVKKVGDSFAELDAKYPSRDFQQALSSSCNF